MNVINGPSYISPTLAEFLQVPYWTKMHEEDIVLKIWDYLTRNNLLIDGRQILVTKELSPVLHPHFYWQEEHCSTEQTIIMVFIAKMHLDPIFIQKDVEEHLENLKKKIACRKIVRFLKANRGNGTRKPQLWLKYLANHYGFNGNGYTSHGGIYD